MARPDRHGSLEILERRKNVAKRYIRGESQWEIARAFEVDQKTISNDLKAIRAEWLAEAVRDINELKARELAKVDAAEEQAWRAWAKSQEDAQVLRARMKGGASETEKVSKGQAGDPRFLDIVLKCVQRRCEILGVIVPGKGGENNGGPLSIAREVIIEVPAREPVDADRGQAPDPDAPGAGPSVA